MKKFLLLFTAILFTGAAFAQKRPAVVSPSAVNTKDVDRVSTLLKDKDFKQEQIMTFKKQPFACEIWVTLDGTVHCRTAVTLKEDAELFFLSPTITFVKANGTADVAGVGGSSARKSKVTKIEGSDIYNFAIKPDKYKKLHSITVTVTSAAGETEKFTITNTKVPVKIESID